MMNCHLLLLPILLLLGACQVQQDIVSASQETTVSTPSLEYVVSLPTSGRKKKNTLLTISLSHSKILQVTGSPYIKASFNGVEKKFFYTSGSGTNAITFSYTVGSSDEDQNGIEITPQIFLNNGTIKYLDDLGALTSAPIALNLNPYEIIIDGVAPIVSVVTYPASGFYNTGDYLNYSLNFNEPVLLTGALALTATLDSATTGPFEYISGTNSSNVFFKRLIQASDLDSDGNVNFSSYSLSSTITDLAGNSITGTIPLNSLSGVYINLPVPKVSSSSSITLPVSTTYLYGQNVDFTVQFSSDVVVTGIPYLEILLNSGQAKANFFSQPAPNTLVFRYNPNYGDEDLIDGINLGQSIKLGTGTIKSPSGIVNADLTLPAIDTSGIKINAPNPLRVIFSYAPLPGLYKAGQTIDFSLMFNRPITVSTTGGTPSIPVYVGNSTQQATFQSLSGTQTAIFRYTVGSSEYDLDGISLGSVIQPNGGSITEGATGYTALYSFVPPVTSGINIDGASPVISSVQLPSNGTYGPKNTIDINLKFNEIVKVTGTPKIDITLGTSTVAATYVSGSETNTLLFRYQIITGDEDTNGIAIGNLSNGTIEDLFGNLASLPLSFMTPASSIKVDGISPTVASAVISPSVGNLTTGSQIDIIVTYSEKVIVEGAPYININIGSFLKQALFDSIDATGTVLTFKYIIEEGLEDLNGIITSNQVLLQPNLDNIKDPYQNIASLSFYPFLPMPSFLTAPSINIDSKAPKIYSVTDSVGGSYKLNDELEFNITWSEPVTITGSPTLTLNIDGQAFALGHTVVSPTITKFTYQITSSTPNSNYLYLSSNVNLNGGTIKDMNGLNFDANITFSPPSLADVIIDTVEPKIEFINSPSLSKTYYRTEFAYIKIRFSESLILTNPNNMKLNLTVGATTVTADYDSTLTVPNEIMFKYTVASGQVDSDGITVNSISLNGSVIKDSAGNVPNITFTPQLFSGIKVNGNPGSIVSITPPYDKIYETAENLDFYVKFDRAVTVTNTPCLKLTIDGGAFRYACLISGSGTETLLFRYEVQVNESASQVTLNSPIDLILSNPDATIKDVISENLNIMFTPIVYSNIKIDSVPIANKVKVSTSAIYYKQQVGGYIEYNLTYPNNVTVGGDTLNPPRINLKIGATTATANYFSGSGTKVLKFRYNYNLFAPIDLDGITVYSPVEANLGTITIAGTSVIGYPLIVNEKDYLYPAGLVARYNFQPTNVTLTNCGSEMCLDNSAATTVIKDISGSNNHITSFTGTGPVVKTGFGTNLTEYAQFDNNSHIELPEIANAKTIIFVMKNPSDVELTTPGKSHVLLSNPTIEDFITMRSSPLNDGINDVMVSQLMTMMVNGILYQDPEEDLILSNNTGSVWLGNDLNILTFDNENAIDYTGSIIGGDSFNGQIAEILILNSTPTNYVKSRIRAELDNIHGVY